MRGRREDRRPNGRHDHPNGRRRSLLLTPHRRFSLNYSLAEGDFMHRKRKFLRKNPKKGKKNGTSEKRTPQTINDL